MNTKRINTIPHSTIKGTNGYYQVQVSFYACGDENNINAATDTLNKQLNNVITKWAKNLTNVNVEDLTLRW